MRCMHVVGVGLLGSSLAGCPASDDAHGAEDTTTATADGTSTTGRDGVDDGATSDGSPATSETSSGPAGSDGATDTGAPSGCGTDPGFSGAVGTDIDVEGTSRHYLLVLPDDYDPATAYPLVFMLHGRGSNGEQLRLYAGVEQAAAGQAIFVYPDGLPVAAMNDQTGWELTSDGRDLPFIDAVYAQLVDNLCIDTDRVYASGHSYGGFFTNSLGCLRGETFRAIAPVAGGGPGLEVCEGQVAAWVAHGTDDMIVPTVLGEMSAATWRAANGCEDRPMPTDPDPCAAYAGCDEGFEVQWCLHSESGLGIGTHTWPSFAGAAIWDFFASH